MSKKKGDTRSPSKTKKDLQEMLAEAVRNTQPRPKPKAPGKRRKP